jgi:glutaminyl-tRNA synthetase
MYDRLLSIENPSKIEDCKTFADYLNPDSLKVLTHCKLEPGLKEAVAGTHYQFERKGFFTVDPDTQPGKPVFNLTATLRDSWAKIEKKN